MAIEYSDFEKALKHVVKLIRFEDDLHTLCRKTYRDSIECEFSFPTLVEDVIRLLEIATDDTSEWISYWVFELDCGKDSDKYEVTMDGEPVKLKTIEDLWNIIHT